MRFGFALKAEKRIRCLQTKSRESMDKADKAKTPAGPDLPSEAGVGDEGLHAGLGDVLLDMSDVASGWGRGMAALLLRAAGEKMLTPSGARAIQQAGLHRLIYISRSTAPDLREATRRVAGILAVAHRHNAQVGLTGALVHSRRWFAQVLEGEREEVDRLFERIRRDPRHRNVQLLSLQPIRHRSFRSWSMAAAGEAPDHLIRRALESLADKRELHAAAREIATLMRGRLKTAA